MNDIHGARTASTAVVTQGEGTAHAIPAAPTATPARSSGPTAGRIVALVVGAILVVTSTGLLVAGGMALWAQGRHRDAAGYVTTGAHAFSSGGSALVTVPAELDSPGVGWFYSSVVLGNVRIRVTSADPQTPVFVGIGPSEAVARYVAGTSHSLISDFWSEDVQAVPGGTATSPPGEQDFWAASATGSGTQTVNWDAANGDWSVIVMNADGSPGVDVRADLGATLPSLLGIAIAGLAIGAVLLLVGALLLVGSIRRIRRGPRGV